MLKIDLTFEDHDASNVVARPQSTPPLVLNQLTTNRGMSRPSTADTVMDSNSKSINLENAFKHLVVATPVSTKAKSPSLFSASGGSFGKICENPDSDIRVSAKIISDEFDMSTIDEKM